MSKKILACFVAVVMLVTLLLTGCVQSADKEAKNTDSGQKVAEDKEVSSEKEEEPKEKAEDVSANLRILWPGTSEVEKEFAAKIQEEFKKKYPKVNIEYLMLVWADIEKKLAVMVQSKDFPDLMMIQDVTNAVAMDALEPLDGYLNDKLNADMFIKAVLDYMKVDGKLYALPALGVGYAHVVNTEMLQAAGYKPEDLKTWDDVKAAVKAMTKDGKYGYAMANGGEGRFTFRDFMMVALSNDVTPDDVSDESKQKYLEVLELFNDMAPYMPKAQKTWLYPELFKAWEAGQVGIMHTGTYFTANLVPHGTSAMKRTQPFVFPKGPSASKPAAMVGAAGFSIIKGSHHKDIAWKLMETIFEPELIGYLASVINMPGCKNIDQSILDKYAKQEYPDCWQEHRAITQRFVQIADKYGTPMPKILGQKPMEKVVQGALIKMLDGAITPEQAYEEIKKGIEQVKAELK